MTWRATVERVDGTFLIPSDRQTGALAEDVGRAVRALVPAAEHADARALVTHAADVAEKLTRHLARLIGEIGIRALFKRSVVLSSTEFPWLASNAPTMTMTMTMRGPLPPAHAALCEAMATQPVDVARDAFIAVLETFVTLLGRLIGEPLVRRLLREIWPAQFGSEKES